MEIAMTANDIRWIQRLNNYSKALGQLTKFIEKGELNELEKQGLIQAFECTFELAWNTIKDFFEAQGETGILGSRDAFRLAFSRGLIEDGATWMNMITSRTLTSHTYNEETAEKIATSVQKMYFVEFVKLHARFVSLKEEQE
jgi:nucleotidyltransferase substrate binding protein (TIGR01987 family)